MIELISDKFYLYKTHTKLIKDIGKRFILLYNLQPLSS